MLKLLLPIIGLVLGLAAGGGAAIALRPTPEVTEEKQTKNSSEEAKENVETPEEVQAREFVKLPNQFVVPVVKSGKVSALVVLSLTVEVSAGSRDAVFSREPRLRDGFLKVLLDYANIGGFSGNFTDLDRLEDLRSSLTKVAIQLSTPDVTDVLILEIAKQDM